MSITTIRWTVDIDAFPQSITSVVLADPTNSYGVIRKDTNAVVVAANTPLLEMSNGVYQYEFTDPVPGLEYRYYIKAVYLNQTFFYERDYSKSAGQIEVTGRYATSDCLFSKFGKSNILTWATFDDSDTEADITARITAAINYADDYVDDRIRGGPYILPFTDPVPSTIVDIACTIAGVKLYTSRGVEDYDGELSGRLSGLMLEAINQLGQIRSGKLQLIGLTGNNHLNTYAAPPRDYSLYSQNYDPSRHTVTSVVMYPVEQ